MTDITHVLWCIEFDGKPREMLVGSLIECETRLAQIRHTLAVLYKPQVGTLAEFRRVSRAYDTAMKLSQ